ncbi:hypothetical protein [Methanosarcina horonobensis]|uniref:hypothetical protein n=1 Tax=Methanosarcina horonobensis TaxID=418008 RepID=UPI000AA5789B|nr:hypothetical protein [Methanosarcina horonobensis]
MKLSISFFLSLFLLFLFSSSASAANILTADSSLENWDDGNTLIDWDNTAGVSRVTSPVHSGTYAASIYGGGTNSISQTILSIEGYSHVSYAFWIRKETYTTCHVNVTFYDSENNILKNTYTQVDGVGSISTWTQYSGSIEIPAGASKVTCSIVSSYFDASRRIYIDDALFTIVDSTPADSIIIAATSPYNTISLLYGNPVSSDTYKLTVSPNSDYTLPVYSIVTTSSSYTVYLYPDNYFWKVEVLNSTSEAYKTKLERSFTISEAADVPGYISITAKKMKAA